MAGAEIDLVIEKSNREKYAIEIKRSLSPSVSKGFYLGSEDIGATRQFILYPGKERFKVTKTIEAISLIELIEDLRNG